MIIGRYSWIKGFVLFLIVLVLVLDIIFCTKKAVDLLNCGFVVLCGFLIIRHFWNKWAEK